MLQPGMISDIMRALIQPIGKVGVHGVKRSEMNSGEVVVEYDQYKWSDEEIEGWFRLLYPHGSTLEIAQTEGGGREDRLLNTDARVNGKPVQLKKFLSKYGRPRERDGTLSFELRHRYPNGDIRDGWGVKLFGDDLDMLHVWLNRERPERGMFGLFFNWNAAMSAFRANEMDWVDMAHAGSGGFKMVTKDNVERGTRRHLFRTDNVHVPLREFVRAMPPESVMGIDRLLAGGVAYWME